MFDMTCVEWRKSTYSGINGCIEIAFVNHRVAIRDSKDPEGQVLLITIVEWRAFLDGARDGEFDP